MFIPKSKLLIFKLYLFYIYACKHFSSYCMNYRITDFNLYRFQTFAKRKIEQNFTELHIDSLNVEFVIFTMTEVSLE